MMTLDYSELRKEFSEKVKFDAKRYGKGPKAEKIAYQSTEEEVRKEFWTNFIAQYSEDME